VAFSAAVTRTAVRAGQLESLSMRGLGIVQEIAVPIALLGFTENEVACSLGIRPRDVQRCLRELQEELDALVERL
jgi:hypothetical protein